MLKVAGTLLPNPAKLEVGEFDISRAERTADGTMAMEIIATKRRIDVEWHMIPDSQLNTILNAVKANRPFFSVEYPFAGGTTTMTCYLGDRQLGLWHTRNGVRYWESVKMAFVER